jgi:hypothetical protein
MIIPLFRSLKDEINRLFDSQGNITLQDLIQRSGILFSSVNRNQDLAGSSNLGGNIPPVLLNFDMQPQGASNWCWAAVSASVSHFYDSLSTWTQCKIASQEMNRVDCCNEEVPSPCNQPWYLDRALQRTSNFNSMENNPVTFNVVANEITNSRVLGTRVGWNNGGGHFLTVYGISVSNGINYYYVDDPIYGKSFYSEWGFINQYQGNGRWTHSYFTN